MFYIAHRVNTISRLQATPTTYGLELDLRDYGDRLIVQHDPFIDGVDFADYLEHYRHGTMILNIKSERIEWRVLELLRARSLTDYFFLDCSFPMIRALVAEGERRIAVRYSEHEPMESALALAGQVEWVWVDGFHGWSLTPEAHRALSERFRLCLVSPELQGRDTIEIATFAKAMKGMPIDAVCTKNPDLWQAVMDA